MKTFKNLFAVCSAVFLSFLISSCASIPPEATQLSGELGKRISAIEQANINLLHKFFELKRNEIDKFIDEEWTPEFAETIFSKPNTKKAWDTIVKENDSEQRLKFLLFVGPALQKEINNQRQKMVKPLDELERKLERKIRAEYTQARSINNTITSFLASASKVAENRQRYLDMVGVTDESIGKVIDGVGDTVNDLVQKGTDIQNKTKQVEEYLKKLKELKNLLK